MPRIYISHRPQDSSHNDIPIIIDLLSEQFGAENIFDTQYATQTIKERQILVKSCDILLVVIGRFWTSMYDETGNNLLFDPYDPVNIEITTGLSTSMVISTVVVDGVDMPTLNDLPETMHDLHKKRIRLSDDETLEVIVTKLMGAWSHIESGTMAELHGINLQTMHMEQDDELQPEHPITTSEHNNMTYLVQHVTPKIEDRAQQIANTTSARNFERFICWSYTQVRDNWIVSIFYIGVLGGLAVIIIAYIFFPHLFVYN